MSTICLIRHGKTEANERHLYCGSTDLSLSEKGRDYRDEANALAAQISRDPSGNPDYPEFQKLAELAADGFHVLTYERKQPVFAGSTVPVKIREVVDYDLYGFAMAEA